MKACIGSSSPRSMASASAEAMETVVVGCSGIGPGPSLKATAQSPPSAPVTSMRIMPFSFRISARAAGLGATGAHLAGARAARGLRAGLEHREGLAADGAAAPFPERAAPVRDATAPR